MTRTDHRPDRQSSNRSFIKCSLLSLVVATALTASTTGASAETISISSSVPQSGFFGTIGTGPAPVTGTGGYNFTGQQFQSLTTIDLLSVTLTLNDADSAPGNFDFDKLTLGLDGINTGILLNGFPDGATATLTYTDVPRDPVTRNPSLSVANAILTALRTDGRLVGSVFSTDRPSNNEFGAPVTFNTTLVISGQATGGTDPVPEPATMLLLGTGLAAVAAKVRKRRQQN